MDHALPDTPRTFDDVERNLGRLDPASSRNRDPDDFPFGRPLDRDRDDFPFRRHPRRRHWRPGRHDPAAEDLFITFQELSLLITRKLIHNRTGSLSGSQHRDLGQQIRDKQATAEQHPWFQDITIDVSQRKDYMDSRREPFSNDFTFLWRRLTQMTESWMEDDDVYTENGQRSALRLLMSNMACATLDGQRVWTVESRYLDDGSLRNRWA